MMKSLFPNLKTLTWYCLLAALILVPPAAVNAQSEENPVLLNIAGDDVTLSEFLRIYNKNNINDEPVDRQALEDYLELYINFRLKVREAVALKMDTVEAFITELDGYRDQLAEPYLTDKEVDNRLVEEAWERMQYDIRASHILVKLAPEITGADTLDAYNKIMELRKRILNGEDFGDVAVEASDDQSARDREANRMHPFLKGNRGDLGYFTVFDMVYPFETMAYSLKPGEVSMPVRTDYGYHIIKVTDKQPAMGRVRVAHIFVRIPEGSDEAEAAAAEAKIRQAYDSIQKGVSFEEVAGEFSEDRGTAKKGGLLSWFGPNRMVPSFIEAVSKLDEIGDISEPVRTDYGWHIIKFVDQKPIASFEEEEASIRKRIERDSRSSLSMESFVEKVKREYGFTENPSALKDFYDVVTDSIFMNNWDPAFAAHLEKPMFTLGEKVYTQQQFTAFLDERQRNRTPIPIKEYVNQEYQEFVNKSCIDYKDSQLEEEFPDFRALMQEYHDGILLFELTDQKVWTKAVKDTSGLESFFSEHRDDYMWGERLDVSKVEVKDEKAAKKAKKLADKVISKGWSTEKLLDKVNKGDDPVAGISRKKFAKGQSAAIDALPRKPAVTDLSKEGEEWYFYIVHGTVPPQPKELHECRGLVTADYQNYLEKEWIKELRAKYPVKVYPDALDKVE